MVVDGHTGKILYSRRGDALRHPASLTKIMTLYLLFDAIEAGKVKPNDRFRVSKNAARQPPSKIGFKPGQSIAVSDAIKALVTKSANDVAVVVAENLAGSEEKFAKAMTAKAKSIGMTRTVFKNASGLPNKHQVTTARDMIIMANRIQFDHPERYGHFSRKYFTYRGRRYRNHNRLLFDYKGTDGIKTGYTRASGFNLLANVRRGDKHLIAVVFGGKTSKSRNAAMRSILNKSMPRAIARAPQKQRRLARKNSQYDSAGVFPSVAAKQALASASQRTNNMEQGSRDAPQTVASLPNPAPRRKLTPSNRAFHIQVGAYARQTDALERLAYIQKRARDVVKGHAPLAMPLVEPDRRLFRARFSGFTRQAANHTCNQLKQRAITCVVMSAE